MYVEAQPASIHAHRLSLGTQSPEPQLYRPPAVLTKSSSSLNGMERTAPSFQSFIKRTPPPNRQKPQGSVPNTLGREKPSAPSTASTRRTSSVYSRTVSRYALTPESWSSRDFISSDLFLRPSLYSLSTPEVDLTSKDETTLLQPRTYSPLIASPLSSPSSSRRRILSPQSEHRPSVLLPPSLPAMRVSPHHVKTVSLDKANAAAHSPGTQALLPEELRAIAQKKYQKESSLRLSRSLEGIGALASPLVPPPLPPSMEDYSYAYPGTPRLLEHSPPMKQSFSGWPTDMTQSRGQKLSDSDFEMDAAARVAVMPVARQSRRISLVKAALRAGFVANEPDFEDRGRSRRRQSGLLRSRETFDHMSDDDLSDGDAIFSEAQRLAEEYHALLREQNSPVISRKSTSVEHSGKDIKLVPQPLFFNPRKISKQREQQYHRSGKDSLFPPHILATEPKGPPKRRRGSLKWPGFPLKLSLTPDSTRDRSKSLTGSIPISPPYPTTNEASPAPSKKSLFPSMRPQPQPHTPKVHRKYSLSGPSPSYSNLPPTPTLTQLPARRNSLSGWLSRGSHSSPTVPSYSPTLHSVPQISKSAHRHRHQISDESGSGASSSASKNPLSKGLASLFSKPYPPNLRSVTEPVRTVSHIRPQISAPRPVDEGWGASDSGKMAISGKDEGSSSGKRPSLFAGMLDQRRESKANRRREELKRTIRVVPKVQETRREGEWI